MLVFLIFLAYIARGQSFFDPSKQRVSSGPEVILYQISVDHWKIFITQDVSGVRSMWFSYPGLGPIKQSSMSVHEPLELWEEYTKIMRAVTDSHPYPKKILSAGLGGGSLARSHLHRFPESRIVTLEIDPIVMGLYQKYFILSNEKMEVTRHEILLKSLEYFVSEQKFVDASERTRYDVVWIDICYVGNDNPSNEKPNLDDIIIPPFLRDSSFLAELKEIVLDEGGMIVLNLYENVLEKDVIPNHCSLFDYCALIRVRSNSVLVLTDLPFDCLNLGRSVDHTIFYTHPFREFTHHQQDKGWCCAILD